MAHSKGSTGTQSRSDRVFAVIAIVAVIFLAFLGGALAMVSDVFPSSYIEAAYKGGKALWAKQTQYTQIHKTDFWMDERTPKTGVTIYDEANTDDGYTLYTSGDGPHAELISRSGEVVHEWRLPYSRIWDETAAVKDPQPDNFMYWRKAHVFPNGDLLAIYVAAGDTPWGYGMVKIDKDSNVLWKYLQHTHHDFDIGPDGKIYALTHSVESTVYDRHRHLKSPHLEDYVVVLSPDGKELKKVSVIKAMADSRYARMLSNVRWYTMMSGDYLHTNNIDLIDKEAAGRVPFARAGQILISLRELNTLAVLDLDEQKIVWATAGYWIGQHDPDFLPNGHLMIYDNLGRFDGGDHNRSRILEIDPTTMSTLWSYEGTGEQPFDSDVRGGQTRLPNGNTLITESSGGRLFEVTSDGRIVWEFINPVRFDLVDKENPDAQPRRLIPIVSWAQRLPRESVTGGWIEQ